LSEEPSSESYCLRPVRSSSNHSHKRPADAITPEDGAGPAGDRTFAPKGTHRRPVEEDTLAAFLKTHGIPEAEWASLLFSPYRRPVKGTLTVTTGKSTASQRKMADLLSTICANLCILLDWRTCEAWG
jgi:hypothetical protein